MSLLYTELRPLLTYYLNCIAYIFVVPYSLNPLESKGT